MERNGNDSLNSTLPSGLDRVITLFKINEKRLQKRFDDIWTPSFKDLEVVNSDYLHMFHEVGCIRHEDDYSTSLTQEERNLLDAAVRYIRPASLFSADRSRAAAVQAKLERERTARQSTTTTDTLGLTEEDDDKDLSAIMALERMTKRDLSDDWRRVATAFQALHLSVIKLSTF